MRRALLVLAACLLGLAGCGGDEGPAPAAAPGLRVLIAGGGTITLHAMRHGDPGRTLCDGFGSVRAPAMHHDGVRFCFLARAAATGHWRIHTASLDAPRSVALDVSVDEESAPVWLPDDRIVYSAPAVDGARALFVGAPTGGEPQRITFSGTDARDPCVLVDGRVLFATTRTTPEGLRAPALMTVHPDGTGVLLFHGATPGTSYAHPRQEPDGDVVFSARTAEGAGEFVADWGAPAEPARPYERGSNGMRVPPPDENERNTCLVQPRPRPQGHLSSLDPAAGSGSLLCIDARRGVSDGAAFVRLDARMLQPDAGAYDWLELGRVPLHPDGSFYASVPADTPLRLDVLDAGGKVLRASRTPFWVRPGETRGCTGCHDAPDTTPPNRQPAAVLDEPVVPHREDGAER